MKKFNLEQIKSRRAAIGEANWSFCDIDPWYQNASILYFDKDQTASLCGDQSKAKAEFIAFAPNDINALIAEVEQVTKQRDAAYCKWSQADDKIDGLEATVEGLEAMVESLKAKVNLAITEGN